MKSDKVNKILELYKDLSEDEKISLFLSLDKLDMREHYDPSYKNYKIEAKNFYGKLLISKTISGYYYNIREVKKKHTSFMIPCFSEDEVSEKVLKSYHKENEIYMSEDEIINYRNETCFELNVFEV